MTASERPRRKRLLLKLSGEVLSGGSGHGLDPDTLRALACAVTGLLQRGCEVGIVVGGGNFVRGRDLGSIDAVTADQMGMLATLVNSLALRDALENEGVHAAVLSAFPVPGIVEVFDPRKASALLSTGTVMIYGGGTGNPYLTTDTAAALRAVQTGCSILLKGTKVDGIYDSDPEVNPGARLIPSISYEDVLLLGLRVMDAAAVAICRDAALPIRVFDIRDPGNIVRVTEDDPSIGSIVGGGADDK